MTREKELACALLWLRNHYDYSAMSGGLKKRVIARIDRVVDKDQPGISDMMEWRAQCQKEEMSTSTLLDSGPSMVDLNIDHRSQT
jgi:hypothetical protein